MPVVYEVKGAGIEPHLSAATMIVAQPFAVGHFSQVPVASASDSDRSSCRSATEIPPTCPPSIWRCFRVESSLRRSASRGETSPTFRRVRRTGHTLPMS